MYTVLLCTCSQGAVDQPIWYQNPGCFGTESCLTSCTSCGDTNYLGICTHSEDVSVRCGKLTYMYN